jgi:hypothetical protein
LRVSELERFIKEQRGTDPPDLYLERAGGADEPFALAGGGDIRDVQRSKAE